MTNWMDYAMLICALIAAMAFGVFAAYGILRAGFALMRQPLRPAVKAEPEMARSLS